MIIWKLDKYHVIGQKKISKESCKEDNGFISEKVNRSKNIEDKKMLGALAYFFFGQGVVIKWYLSNFHIW